MTSNKPTEVQTTEVKKPEDLRVAPKKTRKKTLEYKGPLAVAPIPGYHLRWVEMDNENKVGRVSDFENDLAYETVKPEEIGEDSKGSTVTRASGAKGSTKMILMKTPIEEFNRGVEEKAALLKLDFEKRIQKKDVNDLTSFNSSIIR